MSRAYVCDHCRFSIKQQGMKNQRPQGWGVVRVNLPDWEKDQTYQVCPRCITAVKEFLDIDGPQEGP